MVVVKNHTRALAAERIILKGRTETLKPIITQTLAIHQMLRNRDVGEYVGYAVDEYVRAKPQPLKLMILFYSVPQPPWRAPNGEKLIKATYNIPFVDKTKVKWATIKAACGGANGYTWGRYRATANISDSGGSIRQMQVYGASESEAEQRLKALLTLSEGTIQSLTIAEEKKEGKRQVDKLLYKEATKIYPAYFTVVNQKKIVTESNIPTLSGNYKRTKGRVPLWTTSEPPDAQEIIQEALIVSGSLPGVD